MVALERRRAGVVAGRPGHGVRLGALLGIALSAAMAGCGGANDSPGPAASAGSTATGARQQAPGRARTRYPVAADLTTCVNTLFSHLGAPPEHGGELEPAFVMHLGARHAAPALPGLFHEAKGGVLSANADQIDFRDSPVELYFFRDPEESANALPAAKRELARAKLGPASAVGASGSVIYVERGQVAPDALGAISDCLRASGGAPLPSNR